MKKDVIRVGFDFDGVVAYNPFRVIRAVMAFLKGNILGQRKLKFWYPEKEWQKIFWIIVHESSAFPAKGSGLLKKLSREGKIEAHLITGRYSFLDNSLNRWLRRFRLNKCFKSINLNEKDEQPHIFKERMISKLKLDFFIEDNWDIVNHLNHEARIKKQGRKCKILWIYNILDRGVEYKYKFPYLKRALEEIMSYKVIK